MKNTLSILIGAALALGAGGALAQAGAKAAKPAKGAKPAPAATEAAEPEAPAPAFPAAAPETTLENCRDGVDNDLDGHVDCADQDCWIYAMCIPVEEPAPPAVAPPPPPPGQYVALVPVGPRPERFHQCQDGIDNNGDGLTDCFEPSCQRGTHCRREMTFVPEPEDKAPGLLLSLGLGLALPNFRRPSAEVDSLRYGEDIPFRPDAGVMAAFQIGYLPVPWFGIGADFMGGVSAASNRMYYEDVDEDPYKYDGFKNFAHVGGFIRLQYPAGRFVPYLDIAGGYSYARFYWEVYDGRETWDDIDDHQTGDDSLYYTRDRHTQTTRHFTMALQPGFDVFLRKRSIAIGVKLWLPVFALPLGESSTDNIGVMLGVTYTPTWRERPQLKPEYENAFDAPGSEEPAPAPVPAATVEPVEWEPEPVAPAPEPVAPAPEPAPEPPPEPPPAAAP